jgi:hypothetical protein
MVKGRIYLSQREELFFLFPLVLLGVSILFFLISIFLTGKKPKSGAKWGLAASILAWPYFVWLIYFFGLWAVLMIFSPIFIFVVIIPIAVLALATSISIEEITGWHIL